MTAARIALVAGAAVSVGLMFHVGHRQKSIVLIAMFTVWVLAPLAGLLLADIRSKRWPERARAILHGATLVVALASVAAYADVVLRPPAKPASRFLLVPLASWVGHRGRGDRGAKAGGQRRRRVGPTPPGLKARRVVPK